MQILSPETNTIVKHCPSPTASYGLVLQKWFSHSTIPGDTVEKQNPDLPKVYKSLTFHTWKGPVQIPCKAALPRKKKRNERPCFLFFLPVYLLLPHERDIGSCPGCVRIIFFRKPNAASIQSFPECSSEHTVRVLDHQAHQLSY